MSLLAALVLAASPARVESVYLTTTTDQRLAVRVAMTGEPGLVAVHREATAARVAIQDAALGSSFAGGTHFSWTPVDGFDPARLAEAPPRLDRIEIAATGSEVSLLLQLPPEIAVDVRHDARGLLLVFHGGAAAGESPPTPAAQAASPSPAPAPTPDAAKVEPQAAKPETPPSTAELARQLFPTPPPEGQAPSGSIAELYPQLFPNGAPVQQGAELSASDVPEPDTDEGAVLGPFRVRASVDSRYVDADTFVESSSQPTRDQYLEVQPHLLAAAPVAAGALQLEYAPVFRAFATHDQVNSNSHLLSAGIELPVGASLTLRARDRFQSGLLDTRVVDPGGEYFYDLGHFNRNDFDAGASILVGPRLSVELAGTLGTVHFTEPSSFYDYDSRSASAGLGFELTPRVRATLAYVYDSVPRPDDHPQAEASAHSGRLSLTGELLPLLTGELSVGYRDEHAPNAAAGGTHYSGLTLRAALTRELGRDASFSAYANRSTPLSAFEENGFYVSTGVQGVLRAPLVAKVEGRGGLSYQWNDYRTIALEIGAPREDRIFGWFVGLRRPLSRKLALTAAYRSEHRSSNIDAFDTTANGFYVTLEWDIFGTPPR